ncbi:hypothetical protein Plo01_30060 [Planobispora longispora]|uniref:Uncharacterized protein n=1 Tax=Planobispora longispora TaxID=28887 RepID=A0A8J3W5A0_9ACTN|nr:hypothetical protein Plo01_30060 [Planobispora longispora]
MMPSPSIDMGIRPISPEITKPLTPGLLNSSRYGPTTDIPLSCLQCMNSPDFSAQNGETANSFVHGSTYRVPLEPK